MNLPGSATCTQTDRYRGAKQSFYPHSPSPNSKKPLSPPLNSFSIKILSFLKNYVELRFRERLWRRKAEGVESSGDGALLLRLAVEGGEGVDVVDRADDRRCQRHRLRRRHGLQQLPRAR